MSMLSLQAAWDLLQQRRTPQTMRGDGTFSVLELTRLGDSRLFAAIVCNSAMPAVILDVPLSECPEPFNDTRTLCFYWRRCVAVPSSDRFDLLLELRHPLLLDVFTALASQVVHFITQHHPQFPPAVAARIAVDRWHKLFNPASNGLPPDFPNVDRLKWALLGDFAKPSGLGDPDGEIPF